jgi:hypothetical protein
MRPSGRESPRGALSPAFPSDRELGAAIDAVDGEAETVVDAGGVWEGKADLELTGCPGAMLVAVAPRKGDVVERIPDQSLAAQVQAQRNVDLAARQRGRLVVRSRRICFAHF